LGKTKKVTQIVVGSESQLKLNSVNLAVKRCRLNNVSVTGIKTKSGVNEQPVGLEETLKGALNRARAVQKANRGVVAIGIESGVFVRSEKGTTVVEDKTVVVLISADRKNSTHKISEPVTLPTECFYEAQKRGFKKTTVGSVISERMGGSHDDPHSTVTGGRKNRTEIIARTVEEALSNLFYIF
jgi:non-canonical (house-cleaning) NTP pyrophosphatase